MLALVATVPIAWGQSAAPAATTATESPQAKPVSATDESATTVDDQAVVAADEKTGWWRDFFSSSRAKRKRWQDDEDYQSLAIDTGDAAWSAAAQFRQGEFPTAIESFAELPGEAAMYNHATALAHAGDYQQSLDEYDRLLQQNPQHADAQFNREIVAKLKQQQEQQEQQQQQGKGQDQEQSEGQDEQQDQQQQDGESSDSDQQQPSDSQQQADQSGDANQQQQPGEESQSAPPDLEQLQQAQQAQEQQQSQQQLEQQRQQALRELAEEAPLNEQQQATELWLRQIPDDPSGLLRRKLERSHVNEYPGVTNSKQPW